MLFEIRSAKPEDIEQIGYVHCTAWLETYAGLINSEYLAALSPEKSAEKFREGDCKDILVLVADQTIIGFSVVGPTRDRDLPASFGDIHAVYILRQYQKMGLGKKLLTAAIEKLRHKGYEGIAVWVIGSNTAAVEFYEKNGFQFDQTEHEIAYVTPVKRKRYRLVSY